MYHFRFHCVSDYLTCSPHCLNAGGTGAVSSAGPWTPYEPMKGNMRGGFGICGDPVGNEDHMKTGQYANPKSMPFAAKYEAGGVANFEFDATTNVRTYLERQNPKEIPGRSQRKVY